jgi:DNA-binding NarL/FixJ family response regulator
MDVRMPTMDGIEATRRITAGLDPGTGPRVLMLTTFDLDEYVYEALRSGASGFLLKDVAAERLFEAVRIIAAGDALLAPTVTRRLISEFARLRPSPPAQPDLLRGLTPRETEVLRLVAEGLSNGEIAERLVVGEERYPHQAWPARPHPGRGHRLRVGAGHHPQPAMTPRQVVIEHARAA